MNRDLNKREEITKDEHSHLWAGAPVITDRHQVQQDIDGGLQVLGRSVDSMADVTASLYHYLTDERGMTDEQAMDELGEPEQAIQRDVEQLKQELAAIDQRAAQAQEQIQSLVKATQQPIVARGKSATAQANAEVKDRPTQVTRNNSTQDNVQASISSQDAEKFVNRLAFEIMMPDHAQQELTTSLQQERLALIESYEHKLQQNSRLNQWTETAQIYGEAALGALQEAKDYITEHPVHFTMQMGECAPLGIGIPFNAINQEYAASRGEKTRIQSQKDFNANLVMGAVGGKLIKGIGKASKFLKSRFTAKVEQEVAKRTSSGYGVTKHGVVRKIEREVKSEDILDALKNPLKVGKINIDPLTGLQSQRFINEKVEVVINPQTKKIISSNATRANTRKKLLKQLESKK